MCCEACRDLLPKHDSNYLLKFNIYIDLYFQAECEVNVSITFFDQVERVFAIQQNPTTVLPSTQQSQESDTKTKQEHEEN